MTVLGIETATSVCAAAVVSGGRVLHEISIDEKYVHAEKLLTMVDEVLGSVPCPLAALDGIAVSIGPGSFTGLRIGLSVAKGLVYASDKPLVSVPTLESLAHRILPFVQADGARPVLAMLNARRDEVYCQMFRTAEGSLEPEWEERDMTLVSLLDALGVHEVTVTGDAAMKLRELAQREGRTGVNLAPAHLRTCSAGSIAVLGEKRLTGGKVVDPGLLEPRYIKEFFTKAH